MIFGTMTKVTIDYTVFPLIVENRHGNTNVHNVPEETLINQERKLRNNIKLR